MRRHPLFAWLLCASLAVAPLHALAASATGHSPPNFGSNWGNICDTTQLSQCKAPDAGHKYRYWDLTSNMVSATDDTITTDYNPTDLFMYAVSSGEETGYFDAEYGTTGYAVAWTACGSAATYGGSESDHSRWCSPQDVRYNLSYAGNYDSVNERKSIACEETGHIFGLRHNDTAETTCMDAAAGTVIVISSHEVSHINANY